MADIKLPLTVDVLEKEQEAIFKGPMLSYGVWLSAEQPSTVIIIYIIMSKAYMAFSQTEEFTECD